MTEREQLYMPDQRRLSLRSIRKGSLIEETYAAAQAWNLEQDIDTNLCRIQQENCIGARSSAWLDHVMVTLRARFREGQGLIPLVILAQGQYPPGQWRNCLLWHIGQQDALWFEFLSDWLYPAYVEGVVRMRSEDVVPFVVEHTTGRLPRKEQLSAYSQIRTARDLLLMATQFGLLKGKVVREFVPYHLDDNGFLYVLHALAEQKPNPRHILEAPEWRMYRMAATDVERELLRLHQFQRLSYHAAGSILELQLPAPSLRAYAEGLVS
jgi:hypothetical protein